MSTAPRLPRCTARCSGPRWFVDSTEEEDRRWRKRRRRGRRKEQQLCNECSSIAFALHVSFFYVVLSLCFCCNRATTRCPPTSSSASAARPWPSPATKLTRFEKQEEGEREREREREKKKEEKLKACSFCVCAYGRVFVKKKKRRGKIACLYERERERERERGERRNGMLAVFFVCACGCVRVKKKGKKERSEQVMNLNVCLFQDCIRVVSFLFYFFPAIHVSPSSSLSLFFSLFFVFLSNIKTLNKTR